MSMIAAVKWRAAVDNDMAPEYYDPDIRCTSLRWRLTMRFFLVLALAGGIPGTVTAQSDSGQISGFVRDAQQGALPGATPIMVGLARRLGTGGGLLLGARAPRTGLGPVRRASSEGGSTLNVVPHFGQRILRPLAGTRRSST